jgi:hypothetical protein
MLVVGRFSDISRSRLSRTGSRTGGDQRSGASWRTVGCGAGSRELPLLPPLGSPDPIKHRRPLGPLGPCRPLDFHPRLGARRIAVRVGGKGRGNRGKEKQGNQLAHRLGSALLVFTDSERHFG